MVARNMCFGNSLIVIVNKDHWHRLMVIFRTPVLPDKKKSMLLDKYQRQWSFSLSTRMLKTTCREQVNM